MTTSRKAQFHRGARLNDINPYEPSQSELEVASIVVDDNKESFRLILSGAKQWLWSFRIAFHTTILFIGIGAMGLTYHLGNKSSFSFRILGMIVIIYALLLFVALVLQLLGLVN